MTYEFVAAPSGLRYPIWRAGAGEPLLLLHGFTGSHESWQHLVAKFPPGLQVTTLDLPGHGQAQVPGGQSFSFKDVIDDLAWIIASRLGGTASVLGYSMGGRLALALALSHPDRVHKLILESASPGIEADQEREARRAADEVLAARILCRGLEKFVFQWESLPIWASQVALPDIVRERQRSIRLGHTAAGLAANLSATGTGVQPSYWALLPGLRTPTLLITGELDHKFTKIAATMHASLPNSQHVVVPSAGHAVHLEQPERYVELVSQFLELPISGYPQEQRSHRDERDVGAGRRS